MIEIGGRHDGKGLDCCAPILDYVLSHFVRIITSTMYMYESMCVPISLSRIGFVCLNLGCPVCVGFVVSLSYF